MAALRGKSPLVVSLLSLSRMKARAVNYQWSNCSAMHLCTRHCTDEQTHT